MLALYYYPGSFSIAAHILLEEGGEAYEANLVDLSKGEQHTEGYRKINPWGRVPALRLDNGEVIAENTAIIPYLGKRFKLWPTDPMEDVRALMLIGFFASAVAATHSIVVHTYRYVLDPKAAPTVTAAALNMFHGYLKDIDALLADKKWLVGRYSACDPFAFGFYSWGLRHEFPMRNLKNYTAFRDQMLDRPAVQRVVQDEHIVI